MTLRNTLLASALAAAALSGCGPGRTKPDGGINQPPGCVGVCSQDGGQDAGEEPDAGEDTDGGETTEDGGVDGGESIADRIRAMRSKPFGTEFRFDGVVVTAIDDSFTDHDDDGGVIGPHVRFWVSDPADVSAGILVDMRATDTVTPEGAVIELGDIVNVEGYLRSLPTYFDRNGRRYVLQNKFQSGQVVDPLVVEKVSSGAPVEPVTVSAGFGNADGGFGRPNPQFLGGLVHIPGPVEMTDPSPTAFMRVTTEEDDDTFYGFEVEGGVLVNNYRTFDRELSDGGVEVRCDWRQIALDAGVHDQKVVFPDGIVGIWDSYSHAPCEDGSTTSGCRRDDARVPGTYEAGSTTGGNWYTYAVFPQACENLQGQVVDVQ